MSNKVKGQMTEKKAARVDQLEQVVGLILRDLNALAQHINFLGNTLQATVNVLGQGAVSAEIQRMAQPNPPPAPPSEEEKANAEPEAAPADAGSVPAVPG